MTDGMKNLLGTDDEKIRSPYLLISMGVYNFSSVTATRPISLPFQILLSFYFFEMNSKESKILLISSWSFDPSFSNTI